MSISGWFQPVTMLSAYRPPEMWSITVDCLAATIGWLSVMCEVANTPGLVVEAAMPAAQA
jgi:hypothetical protein